MFKCLSTTFLNFFWLRNSKRRRRDLNPRAAINDLLPFQGSPFGQLGYFSKLPYLLSKFFIKSFALLRQLVYSIKSLFVCQALFYFFKLCFKFSVLRQLDYSIKMFFICQELFKLFYVEDKAEKEGFEPSRQFPDLYP